MKSVKHTLIALLMAASPAIMAQNAQWQPVTGVENLRQFVSGKAVSWEEGPGTEHRGEYRADGTGTLYAWGTEFERRWEVKGDDQICFYGEPENQCYTLDKSTTDSKLFRVTEVATGAQTEIREDSAGSLLGDAPAGDPNRGGPAMPSAEELAAKLANPANPIMKIGNNFDYQWFDGDLPGANDQTSFKYVFLTVFPFKLDNGNSIFFRPGIPLLFEQPVPDGQGGFTKEGTDLGDTAYDVLYSGTTDSGTIWGFGAAGTLPTATNDKLGKDLWGLGPEALLGVAKKWGVVGGLLSHQWDVGGSGTGKINTTNLSYFYSFPLGGGWQFASAPVISYNHEAADGSNLTLPLGIGVSKTTVLWGRPWTFQVQYWNNVERPDAFAPEHTIRLSILPVISAPWNKGK